jgi:hypothetical protein
MDHQQVLDLFEELQNDIEGFDDILLETVRNMETEEHEQYGCFESFPFRQHFVIFVRQIT